MCAFILSTGIRHLIPRHTKAHTALPELADPGGGSQREALNKQPDSCYICTQAILQNGGASLWAKTGPTVASALFQEMVKVLVGFRAASYGGKVQMAYSTPQTQ